MGSVVTDTHHRYRNALIGLAAGDAWGYQVEFISYRRMPSYPVKRPHRVWRISDDTQMTLALHHALDDAHTHLGDVRAVTDAIIDRFQNWRADPDNTRAPGATCMGSLAQLARGEAWHSATGARESAGCGAVMRLVPAAMCPPEHWRGITALQAVITHKHPVAVAAALLLAEAVRNAPARAGRFLEHAIETGLAALAGDIDWAHDPYLREVLSPWTSNVGGLLADGFDELLFDALCDAAALKRRLSELPTSEWGDPCAGIGQGWESATAVALGLLVADMAAAPLNGVEALAWAATSNGDSDSIASIAGGLIGATHRDPAYWSRLQLGAFFEPRYARELRRAAATGPAFHAVESRCG